VVRIGGLGLVPFGVQRVEAARDPGPCTVQQRPVVALDHPNRRAHDPGKLEHGHPGSQRVRGERGAQVIDAGGPTNPCCLDRRCPLAASEVIEVHQPAMRCREDQDCFKPGRDGVERRQGAAGERHLAAGTGGLSQLNGFPAAHGAENV
jgi:hypothetical protein